MTVLVTGGTGFVGSHTVAALRRDGRPVRLLVRDPARVRPALAPLGVDPDDVEVVVGDVTDPAAVAAAVRGCAAALHAASVYSFDPRRHARMRAVNVRGTEVVLAAARAAGVDPIGYVSTFGALLPADHDPVTPDSPVGRPRETYLATKAEAELVARRHQAEGAPVVITYPVATLGPHDPHLGDQSARLRNLLRGLMPIWPTGGFPVGDVRDVARLHVAVLRPGQGGGRFLGPGRFVDTGEYVRTVRRVTGRRLPSVRLPAVSMLPVGRLADLAQRALPVDLPAQYGAIYTCRVARGVDTAATDRLLGAPGRPFELTVADTVRWLVEAGHLSPRQAGRAVGPPA
ncbi:NAD-dependent epimerase/dehydratase family protein [Micromonospora sp. WMMD882]|uniref:NAD-dependent epimerase/dehydratase family protein n=1 Tax=Micromonospora sp. WMMD882 TaxID=3015151 RepID=UPI00248B4A8B|nr:NAD-dependent epimerase/dehydratase family protein [Micromonospora sp. WMMD882]WBB80688.1 NAD-dependent epimerase/dehydratase family protein [Micromonospora sp. WMMD882]